MFTSVYSELEWFYLTHETNSNSQCLIVEWKQKKTMELESTNIYLSNIYFTG
jgi:hypothetical protein